MKIFNNFSVRDLLHRKRFAVIFSVLVAFIIWLVIVIEQNPEREHTFNNLPIEISTEGSILKEMGVDVVDAGLVKTASVTVYGPNYIVSSLRSDDVKVKAVVNDITAPGTYSVKLIAVSDNVTSGYTILKINPSNITIKLDYIDTLDFTVVARVDGVSAIEGLIAETPIVNGLKNSTLRISGPKEEMKKISLVEAYAKAEKTLSATTSFDAELRILDDEGNELDKSVFTISEEKIKVSVPISKKKTVGVQATFDNADFALISILKHTYSKPSVEVIGPPDTIDALNEIELTSIDISKISLNNTSFDVSPILPDGVRVLDNLATVTVNFNLADYTEKSFDILNITCKNKPSDISSVNTAGILRNVKICGPSNIMNELTAGDLIASIDLSGKSSGEHIVGVKITSEKFATVWAIDSYELSVELK